MPAVACNVEDGGEQPYGGKYGGMAVADLFKVHWIIVPAGDFNDRGEQVEPERNLRSAFNERFNRVHSLDKGKHDLFIVIDVYLLR